MTHDEAAVSERAEAALKTNAEAYRLAQKALDMRREQDEQTERARRAEAEVARLRAGIKEAYDHLATASVSSNPQQIWDETCSARDRLWRTLQGEG